MVYTLGMLPVVSNDFGGAFLRETMSGTSFIVEWSLNWAIFGVKWSWKGPRGGYGSEKG